MSTPARRRNSWLVTVPIAAIAGIYLWFVFLPGKRAIEAAHVELRDKQAFIAGIDRVKASIGRVEAEIQATKDYCQRWCHGSADSTDMAELFGIIAELLKSSGVVTTRFTPEAGTSLEFVQKLPLRIGFEGTFEQVAQVLEKLERLPQRIWVDQINMKAMEENREKVTCELSLVVFAGNSGKKD